MASNMGWRAGSVAAWLSTLPALATAVSGAAGASAVGAADSLPALRGPTAQLQSSAQSAVDWATWLSKRRQFTYRGVPYGVTGLPLVYYNTASEWTRSMRLRWTDYSRAPFRYKAVLSWRHTADRVGAYWTLRVPRIGGTAWGLQVQVDYSKGLRQYYGLGNDSSYDRRLTDPGHPAFLDESYYSYRLRKPRVFFSFERQVLGPVRAVAGFGVKWVQIDRAGPVSYLYDVRPYGLRGGTTGLVSAVLRWDTRDDEGLPRRGALHEWSYELSHGSPEDRHLFNEIAFHRYTVTDLRYAQVGRRLWVANRAVFEVLAGRPPIDVYGDIGGIRRRVAGLGGDETLRGYGPYRFTDDVRLFANTEARVRLHTQRLLRQYLEWTGVAFVDLGRVWHEVGAVTPAGLRATGGAGLRLYWNEDFVLRLETAGSGEGIFAGVQLGNLF